MESDDPVWYDGTPEYETEKAALFKQIEDAFGSTVRPSDENIAYDNEDYDGVGARELLKGLTWQEAVPQMLLWRNSLFYVSEEAFLYYLPGYMMASLHDDADVLFDNFPFFLAPSSFSWKTREVFDRMFAFVTEPQRASVCAYLQLRADASESAPPTPPAKREESEMIPELLIALRYWKCD